ncbi:hypothetical protein M407DRAFT_110283 [Tulasnella calospora MUT 4182]|uniref:DUF6593 domain-containing protein n=1 Tax=Tulasnella calospora MUT 4182 TaxID=1051891 RepID=A0A0C3QD09_9AGAM|nr:hypothetical protein M407DRAFT_110283 [Tulasnella calospora MUT 4182]
MNAFHSYIPNFETLVFPEGDFDGRVIDPPGYLVYNLFTNRRFFASDTTSITRPNGTSVAVIVWGSVWQLERRKILFPDMTISARKFLTHKYLGSPKRWFRTGDGRQLFWMGPKCYDGATGALVATCRRSNNGYALCCARTGLAPGSS